jgi:hypothetical protein
MVRLIDAAILNTVWENGDSMLRLGPPGSYERTLGVLTCAVVLENLALRRDYDPAGVVPLTDEDFIAWRTATVQAAEDAARAFFADQSPEVRKRYGYE